MPLWGRPRGIANHLTGPPRLVKGLYDGTAVDGTFSGGATEGTFTLMANGMVLANGTYSCDPSGCVFTGK